MNPCYWKTILVGSVCFSIFSGITAILKQLVTAHKRSDKINKVLMYGAIEVDKKKQLALNNLFCIYYVLVRASQTIDVCTPSLSEAMSECLINVHQKNKTKLRLVVHKSLDLNFKQLVDCGIEVKVVSKAEVGLEHEFMLIDALGDCEEALAIIGSIDFEVKRVHCNDSTTMLTSENAIVVPLKREFDRIWNSILNTEPLV